MDSQTLTNATGTWIRVSPNDTSGKIIETETIWHSTIYRVWLPALNTVVRVPEDKITPLDKATPTSPVNFSNTATAARIADTLTTDTLLAPLESSVIPLPHQLHTLKKAISQNRVRYLLADEVGLGKTIEAGLILRELKLRGRVKRVLIVVPKGLTQQWVSEMYEHFSEEFQLVLPSDISLLKRFNFDRATEPNERSTSAFPETSMGEWWHPWRMFDQVVVPMDAIKPVDRRKDWTEERIADYNQERFEGIISAGWDLVIVDEAHRLAGSSAQVARHRLGKGLAEAAPYMLLLTATPHRGKRDAFRRLMSLLDEDAFPDEDSVSRDRVQPYVVRTEKRQAIDADGNTLFRPRSTRLEPVQWGHADQKHRQLYDAVTDYVRWGYNQALQEKKNYIGFLMILMQRLVSSSTRAVRTALEKRLELLKQSGGKDTQPLLAGAESWEDLDGQEQLEVMTTTRFRALRNERQEVERLVELAQETEQEGPDAKAQALLDWVYGLQREEGDPELKLLVFTEFVPTQEMLCAYFEERGFRVARLNGSMNMEDRREAREEFANDARILISTDAGGEGLNLQFCHVAVNYDIPWNPMKLEQRIGRVDRIGHHFPVRAVNLVLEDTVEHRVREVLENKLSVILSEFGVDKTSDVLDSADSEKIFDNLYMGALLRPDAVAEEVDSRLGEVREQFAEMEEGNAILGTGGTVEPEEAKQAFEHPLHYWVERMVTTYVQANGGKAEQNDGVWRIVWPDDSTVEKAVFSPGGAERHPEAEFLTLENPKVRGLTSNLPRYVEGQPIPVVSIDELPEGLKGSWSLWRIEVAGGEWQRHRFMPLFINEEGQVFHPTARRIWEDLIKKGVIPERYLKGNETTAVFRQAREEAERHGRSVYEALRSEYNKHMQDEKAKAEYAFAARRRAIEKIGLPEVRNQRLAELEQERQQWEQALKESEEIMPDLVPIMVVWVDKQGDGKT